MTEVIKNKEVFTIKKDDKDIALAVKKPTPAEGRKAQQYYNQTFALALTSKGLLRACVESHMREQGLWDDKKEAQQRDFMQKLADMEIKLAGGGIKLTEARKIALQMRETRGKFRELLIDRNQLDVNTVEGQAENARFNALVSLCLVYNDSGEPYYKSVDDYLERSGEPEAFQAASILGQMLYKLDKNYDNTLPENQFLKKYKFVNEELRLVNKDGKLVDEDGRLIDENGRYITSDGKFVDRQGRPVDEDGNYVVVSEPFLDDDGSPIVEVA